MEGLLLRDRRVRGERLVLPQIVSRADGAEEVARLLQLLVRLGDTPAGRELVGGVQARLCLLRPRGDGREDVRRADEVRGGIEPDDLALGGRDVLFESLCQVGQQTQPQRGRREGGQGDGGEGHADALEKGRRGSPGRGGSPAHV